MILGKRCKRRYKSIKQTAFSCSQKGCLATTAHKDMDASIRSSPNLPLASAVSRDCKHSFAVMPKRDLNSGELVRLGCTF